VKFPESWLRSFVDPKISTRELARVLTMGGLDVESVEPVAPAFDKVVVGQVLQAAKHPNADRLTLCKVDVGGGTTLAIVCGAPNVVAGMKAPVALLGARLPGMEIKQAKVRGVESSGMLCSARDLGLSQDHSGLLVLPVDAQPGADVRRVLDLDDQLITLKLTPNRGDCLSLRGIAREVSILTATPLIVPAVTPAKAALEEKREILLQDAAACPRYCGRIIRSVDVKARTPDWMVRRLERCGMRSISAIVDITNFVMLELGQPLHAFDNRAIEGEVIVRRARKGERLRLLNGQEIELTPDVLLIADTKKPLALGGIMGGEASAVSGSTAEVFLEAAWFNPSAVAGRARRFALSSDAAFRFERGVDFATTPEAIERATQLVLDVCGGAAGPISEAAAALPQRNPVVTAKAVATLDHLAGGGRVLLGIGVGWLAEEFAALGLPFADRGLRTDEYVEAMRALWSQECASFKGQFISFDRVFCRPLPPARSIPIIVGGDTVAAARRAGRLGDGYFPARTPSPGLLDEMRRAAQAAGRDPKAIEITVAAPADLAEIEALARQGVARVAVPVSAAAGLPAQVKTPDDVLRYGKDVIARFR